MKTLAIFTALALGAGSLIAGVLEVPPPAYTLHEWGTFTSVSGSDGVLLPGLEAEEEALPRFVESHAGMANGRSPFSKGWSRPLSNVTIKMETPVIYFYTPAAFAAHVEVGFRGGSISQWYPRRSSGEKPPAGKVDAKTGQVIGGEIDFAKRYDGSIAWDVNVAPAGDDAAGRVFKPGETLNWLYPRQTDSAVVTTANGDSEKFLFYRGVGNFPLPVVFTLPNDTTVRVENKADTALRTGMVFNLNPDGTAWWEPLGEVPACGAKTLHLGDRKGTANWHRAVYDAMAAQLTEAGLYRKEADAMLQTWWGSYFQKPGLRVFWIVQEKETEGILPLSVKPAPVAQARVLVGRSELLTPAFERQLTEGFADAEKNPWRGDRYFAPYAARVKQLAKAK